MVCFQTPIPSCAIAPKHSSLIVWMKFHYFNIFFPPLSTMQNLPQHVIHPRIKEQLYGTMMQSGICIGTSLSFTYLLSRFMGVVLEIAWSPKLRPNTCSLTQFSFLEKFLFLLVAYE